MQDTVQESPKPRSITNLTEQEAEEFAHHLANELSTNLYAEGAQLHEAYNLHDDPTFSKDPYFNWPPTEEVYPLHFSFEETVKTMLAEVLSEEEIAILMRKRVEYLPHDDQEGFSYVDDFLRTFARSIDLDKEKDGGHELSDNERTFLRTTLIGLIRKLHAERMKFMQSQKDAKVEDLEGELTSIREIVEELRKKVADLEGSNAST
ncbi:hypothetical protein ACFL3T_00100 [Patescibacteria group bacterium]